MQQPSGPARALQKEWGATRKPNTCRDGCSTGHLPPLCMEQAMSQRWGLWWTRDLFSTNRTSSGSYLLLAGCRSWIWAWRCLTLCYTGRSRGKCDLFACCMHAAAALPACWQQGAPQCCGQGKMAQGRLTPLLLCSSLHVSSGLSLMPS